MNWLGGFLVLDREQVLELLGSVMMAWEREHMRKSRRVGLWHMVGGRNEA